MLEQGLASALGVHVGQSIRLGGRRFQVGGIAVQTEQAFYPACTPGLVWVSSADATRLAGRSRRLGELFDVKLTDPAAAGWFADGAAMTRFSNQLGNGVPLILATWQQTRTLDYKVASISQKAMLTASWLLAILAIASIAVVVGSRLAEQRRRVGLLKAVGASPSLTACVLLAENLVLATVGAGAGLLAGWLLAPSLANPGSGLLGAAPTPPVTGASAAEVTAAALAVATIATIGPVIRGVRTSTLAALNNPARRPRRHAQMITLSARLPIPVLLAVRLIARQPRRTFLTAAALTTAATMVVAAITLQQQIANQQRLRASGGLLAGNLSGRVTHLVLILGAILVVVSAVNAIFTTWATVIDSERLTATARTLGATPHQITAALTTAELIPALAAALLGIPAGLGIYTLAGGHLAHTTPPFVLALTVIPGMLAIVSALTAIPARIAATRPIAHALRSD